MHKPLISIIIPSYNYGSTLKRAVDSVRLQGLRDIEIVIVNDCSTDNTREVVASLDSQNIIYIENDTNFGVYESLNKGIKAASGSYICQLDADDELTKGSLITRYELLEQNSIDAVHGGIIVLNKGVETYIGPVSTLSTDKIKKFLLEDKRKVGINNATFMYRREVFSKIGYFYTSGHYFPHNDYEFALRTLLHCKVGFIDEPLYKYYRHEGSHSHTNAQTKSSQDTFRALENDYAEYFSNKVQT